MGDTVIPTEVVSMSEPGQYEWMVESLLRIHQKREVKGVSGQTRDQSYCKECSRGWPCKTAQLAGIPDDREP